MYQKFIFILLLVTTLSSKAQIQSGGGGPDGRWSKYMTKEEYIILEKAWVSMITKLELKWESCQQEKPSFDNLSDLYVTLVLRNVLQSKNNSCQKVGTRDSLSDCLFDKEMLSELDDFFNKNKMNYFLESAEQPFTLEEFKRFLEKKKVY